MQVVDKDGNVYGQGLQITSINGKPKVPLINTDITIGTTAIVGGTSGRLLFDDAGVVGETNGVHWDKVNSRFGIGTTTPLFPLDILGTAKFASATSGIIIRDWTAFNTYRAIYKASETPSDLNYLLAMDQDVLINSRGSGTDIRFNGAIRARFGNAFSLRVIGSGNTTTTVGFEAANSSSTPLLQVRDNGVVLIGTTTDSGYKLDVAGTIRSQSSLVVANPSFTNGGSITHSANSTLSIVGGPASESIVIGPSNRIFINAGQTRFPVGSVQIAGTLSVGEANTTAATMLWITGGITASSSIARGISLVTTLAQSAANDVLTAVNIAPTFTVNSTLFHDVYWARITGSYAPAAFTANNNATTIDLNNSFTNTNNAVGIRIRHTYSNVQNGFGILLESASFIGIAQTSLTSTNFLAGTTVIGSSVVAAATGYTLHVTNGTNGAIKVGSVGQGSEHLIISHSQAGNTFSSIRNTYASTGASMLIDVAGQGNLRLFGTGNVAINNTVDAGYKLDVNGTVRVKANSLTLSPLGLSTPPANYIGINFDETPNHHQLWYAINSKKDISGIGTSYDRIIFPTMGSDNSTWQFNALGTYSRIQISARNNASGNYLDLTNSSISLSGPWTVVSIDRGNRKLVFGNMSTDVHHLSVYDIVIKGAQPFEGNYGNSNGGNVYLVGGTPSTTPAGNYGNVILAHDSTAARGNVLVGTSTNVPSAVVNVNSTTQGFLPPRMSNAQMLAIRTPSEGLVVYDLTNRKLCCYDGATWQPLF